MKKKQTIWEWASEREGEHGGGMPYILDLLLSLHPTTDEAQADLTAAVARYDEQMNQWARIKA